MLVVSALAFALPASSQQISFDTASAHAVLQALRDPNLDFKQAINIARLDGNQGMIKKTRELGEVDTDEQFAHAFATAI